MLGDLHSRVREIQKPSEVRWRADDEKQKSSQGKAFTALHNIERLVKADTLYSLEQEVQRQPTEDRRTDFFLVRPGDEKQKISQDNAFAALPKTMAGLIAMSHLPGEKLQHRLSDVQHWLHYIQTFNLLDKPQRARLLSQGATGASAFLQALPFEPALTMRNDRFQFALQGRLGLVPEEAELAAACTSDLTGPDRKLEHMDMCKIGGGSQNLHNLGGVAPTSDMMTECGVVHRVEPRAELAGFGQGGADIVAYDFPETGKTSAIEVSIPNPTTITRSSPAALLPLYTADEVANDKRAKYEAACDMNGLENWQVIIEVPGALGRGTLKVIAICEEIAMRRGRLEHAIPSNAPFTSRKFKQYWMQRFSVALQSARFTAVHLRIKGIPANNMQLASKRAAGGCKPSQRPTA